MVEERPRASPAAGAVPGGFSGHPLGPNLLPGLHTLPGSHQVAHWQHLAFGMPSMYAQGLGFPHLAPPNALAIGHHNPLGNMGFTVAGNLGHCPLNAENLSLPLRSGLGKSVNHLGENYVGDDGRKAGSTSSKRRKTRLVGHTGIYMKDLTTCEAQLEVSRFYHILSESQWEIPGKIFHLGIRQFNEHDDADKEAAITDALKSLDRAIIKLMEVHNISHDKFKEDLHFPYSGYTRDAGRGLSFDEYVSELRDEAVQRTPSGCAPQARKWKGVYSKRRHNGGQVYAFEARNVPLYMLFNDFFTSKMPGKKYTKRKALKSFGTYKLNSEAAKAFDLGTILAYGTDQRLNSPLTKYMLGGHFLQHIESPQTVIESVQYFLNSMISEEQGHELLEENIARIRSYYSDVGSCPFYDVRDRS